MKTGGNSGGGSGAKGWVFARLGANPVPVVVRPTLTRRLHAVGAVHSLDILDATPPSAPPMPCGGVSATVVAAAVRVTSERLAGL